MAAGTAGWPLRGASASDVSGGLFRRADVEAGFPPSALVPVGETRLASITLGADALRSLLHRCARAVVLVSELLQPAGESVRTGVPDAVGPVLRHYRGQLVIFLGGPWTPRNGH